MIESFLSLIKEQEYRSIPIDTFGGKSASFWYYNLRSKMLQFLPKKLRQDYPALELLNWYSKGWSEGPGTGTVLRKEIRADGTKYAISFSLYNVRVIAWKKESKHNWSFDIGKRAKGMQGGEVVNFLKKMLPLPNDKKLRPPFDKNRPYNKEDKKRIEREKSKSKEREKSADFDRKYIETDLKTLDKTLKKHDWTSHFSDDYVVVRNGIYEREDIRKMLAYLKDFTNDGAKGEKLFNAYHKKYARY